MVGVDALVAFAKKHADAESPLQAWLAEAKDAEWRTPQDVKDRYAHASILAGDRVVFNVKGNDYRLLVRISYVVGIVRVERIGTHAEYDKWKL